MTKLVIGASGFLGSHVTRQLVERGEDVRILARPTSSLKAIDDLDVDRRFGDIFDHRVLLNAMSGCDVVFYCVVDTRAWLRDPAPLYRTNVDGLRSLLEAAAESNLSKFVFTSTIGTIAISRHGPATEDLPFNWYDKGGDYIRSRVQAEQLVLRYSTEHRAPAVAMCVANTYGPGDWQPTPHGSFVAAAAAGRMPFYVKGMASEVVGVEDAARALILAADKGRPGQRYIVSERFMDTRELLDVAADTAGVRRPRFGIPLNLMYALGFGADIAAKLLRRDVLLTSLSVRLMHIMSPMDHGKAMRELGWEPTPVHDAIGDAVRFYRAHSMA